MAETLDRNRDEEAAHSAADKRFRVTVFQRALCPKGQGVFLRYKYFTVVKHTFVKYRLEKYGLFKNIVSYYNYKNESIYYGRNRKYRAVCYACHCREGA